jgi:hypothetical protein
LFYALAVFLKKWVHIKKDIPIKKKLKYMEINQPENVKTKMCRTRAGYIVNFIAKMINMLISTVTEQLKNFLVVHL